MSHFITDSPFTFGLRDKLRYLASPFLSGLIECPQCVGLFSGLICGLLLSYNVYFLIMCGFAGSFVSALGERLLNYIEAKSVVDIEDDEK